MGREKIALTPEAKEAALILGQQIRLRRHQMQISGDRLAAMANVSRRTLTLIERGDPSVSFGNVLNVAVHAGVPLFDITDPKTLARVRHQLAETLTFVPSNVRNRKLRGTDNDF